MSILACLLGVGFIAYDVEGQGVVDVEGKGDVDVEGKDVVVDIAEDATDSSMCSIIGKTSSSSPSGGSYCLNNYYMLV